MSSGDSELHLRAGAEVGASALASGEDAEVMMVPTDVLKKAQQSTGDAKVREATSTGQKVKSSKHDTCCSPEYSMETSVERSNEAARAV